ncbi:MAG TPA: D-alanyl-D-alanine carboxypeptidase/D-alanyl-D-alanine-endopeptidase [Pyrinomonadaceae bacterium]|nr:D-alanyl-D-alanine carboxypeptidase/D-alanyl-D-alanine-endopeptidase [Pyrinomonadaceae bacterium]
MYLKRRDQNNCNRLNTQFEQPFRNRLVMKKTSNVALGLVLTLLLASVSDTHSQNPSTQPSPGRPATQAQEARPVASPTPRAEAVTQSPAPQQTTAKTASSTTSLAELQSRLIEVLRKPELSAAVIGLKVASLETGRVLFEENANKLLRPASNMKLYTVAAALDRLGPDFRFTTSMYSRSRPDAAGIVHGDLTIYGRGDPSIAARFNSGDYFKGIDELATRIAAAGVKRVEGDLIGDETWFVGPQYGAGWEWEDLQWWYGAEISALSVNDNALDLSVKPGPRVGAPALITTGPPDPLLSIVNNVVTVPSGTRREVRIHRGLGAHVMEIAGAIPIEDRGYSASVGISHPGLLFIYLLRSSLAKRGVVITGRSRNIPASALGNSSAVAPATSLIELAAMQSAPFSLIAAQTLKPSQNLYTELILRTLGKVAYEPTGNGSNSIRTSEAAGLEVLKAFLKRAGVDPASLVLSDGSGLSRNDMITPAATLELLTYMNRHTHADVFRDALPVGGVDGTLRNRLKGTVAENNVRAKTGSLSSAASLSGYLTSVAGERLVFSVIVNNYPEGVEPRSLCIDPIVVLLASFAGRS